MKDVFERCTHRLATKLRRAGFWVTTETRFSSCEGELCQLCRVQTIPRPEGSLSKSGAETKGTMGEHGEMGELVVGLTLTGTVLCPLSNGVCTVGNGLVRPKPCDNAPWRISNRE